MSISNLCYCGLLDAKHKRLFLCEEQDGFTLPSTALPETKLLFFPDNILYIRQKMKELYGLDVIVLRHLIEDVEHNIHFCELELIGDEFCKNGTWHILPKLGSLQWKSIDEERQIQNWLRGCSHETPNQIAQQRIWTAARKESVLFA